MPRRQDTKLPLPHKTSNRILFWGDSLTFTSEGYTREADYYPAVTERILWSLGIPNMCHNFGRTGRHTGYIPGAATIAAGHIMDRVAMSSMIKRVAKGIVIYASANDNGNGIPTADTKRNLGCLIKAAKHRAYLFYPTAADLPANFAPGTRAVVINDNGSTGGRAHAYGQTPTIGGPGSDFENDSSVWECRFPTAGVNGWGRIATRFTKPTKTEYIWLVSLPYLFFSSGGDTLATPYAPYNDIRENAQKPVVTYEGGSLLTTLLTDEQAAALNCPGLRYVDWYGYARTLVNDGIETIPGSFHVDVTDQHPNTYGHSLCADCLVREMANTYRFFDKMKGRIQ